MGSKITHLTITTGHSRVIEEGEVSAVTLAVMREWIPKALVSNAAPLPVAALSHFSSTAFAVGSGVVMTINAPAAPHVPGKPHYGRSMPLVTIGVATNAVDADQIWDSFCRSNTQSRQLEQPPVPWCAVILYPTLQIYPGGCDWLGDFERSLAVACLLGI